MIKTKKQLSEVFDSLSERFQIGIIIIAPALALYAVVIICFAHAQRLPRFIYEKLLMKLLKSKPKKYQCPICGCIVEKLKFKKLLGIWACDSCYRIDDDKLMQTDVGANILKSKYKH